MDIYDDGQKRREKTEWAYGKKRNRCSPSARTRPRSRQICPRSRTKRKTLFFRYILYLSVCVLCAFHNWLTSSLSSHNSRDSLGDAQHGTHHMLSLSLSPSLSPIPLYSRLQRERERKTISNFTFGQTYIYTMNAPAAYLKLSTPPLKRAWLRYESLNCERERKEK